MTYGTFILNPKSLFKTKGTQSLYPEIVSKRQKKKKKKKSKLTRSEKTFVSIYLSLPTYTILMSTRDHHVITLSSNKEV